jgi:hypothetical protein
MGRTGFFLGNVSSGSMHVDNDNADNDGVDHADFGMPMMTRMTCLMKIIHSLSRPPQ